MLACTQGTEAERLLRYQHRPRWESDRNEFDLPYPSQDTKVDVLDLLLDLLALNLRLTAMQTMSPPQNGNTEYVNGDPALDGRIVLYVIKGLLASSTSNGMVSPDYII